MRACHRGLLAVGLVLGFTAGIGSCSAPEPLQIHADEGWYLAMAEREQVWGGLLGRNEQIIGPDTRGGLSFALITDEGERLPVYAGNAQDRLSPLVGSHVRALAKVVTPSHGARELWIASVLVRESSSVPAQRR